MNLIKIINNFIGSNQLEEAIEFLLEYSGQNKPNYDSLILLKSKYKENETSIIKDIISRDDYNRSSAQIINNIQKIINEISIVKKEIINNQNLNNNHAVEKNKEKILFLASDPKDQPRYDMALEFKNIREQFQKSHRRDLFEFLIPEFYVTPEIILDAMIQEPSYVHFSGSCIKEGLIVSDSEGLSFVISTSDVVKIFRKYKKNSKLIFLNACHSSFQAKPLSELGMTAIGMKGLISDAAAIEFATLIYRGIASEDEIENSFESAMISYTHKYRDYKDIPQLWKNGHKMN